MQTLPNVMPDITQRNIYGELYGGCIRREIKYHTDRKFIVFDVHIDGTRFLPYDQFDIVAKAGFDTVAVFETGTLADLINRPTEFKSTYSHTGEGAEGYVLKYIDNDCQLYAVKHKAPSFVESHTGKVTTQREIKIDNAPKPLRDIGDMKPYLLNTNRLSALYSKIGPPTEKTNTDVITRDLIKDAVKDYATEQGVDIANVMNTAFTYFQEVLYFVNEDLKTRLG